MKKKCLLALMAMVLCLAACGPEKKDGTESQTQTEPGTQEDTAFALTEQGKTFLARMCKELRDFDSQTEKDETFWHDFLFYSYTGASDDAVMEKVHREKLDLDETVVKVSLQEAQAHARLVFGVDLPDYKPAFADMKDDETAFYYQDGYYYIGLSDFPPYQYTFAGCEQTAQTIVASYTVGFEDGSDSEGKVSLTLQPADNENGFVIISKTTV